MSSDEMTGRALPELPNIAARKVMIVILCFMAFVGVSMTGLFVYFHWLVPGKLAAVTAAFPEPTLQISPQGDLSRFKREQTAPLTGYAWVDRGHGIARIPIEDAMRIIAGRREMAFEPLEGPAVTPTPGSRGGDRP